MKLITYLQKIEGQPPRPERPQDEVEFWQQAKPGRYQLEIKRMGKPKSDKQRGDIFGNMIQRVVDYCNDNDHIVDTSDFLKILFDDSEPSGVAVTKDFIKACLYTANPTLDENDKPITLSDMTTEQASHFRERSADLLSSRFCFIPNPDKNYKNKLDA